MLGGGVRMLPITTPAGTYRVWTKRTGNNPATKLLLLHGGPGATHEYLLGFDSFLPGAGVEYYYYDQLGSGWSDRPDEPSLWTIERFVDEVEQVRLALGLDRENFVLYGQSWGGILAIEYALAHQQHLKGLVISNMMASIPAYNRYASRRAHPGAGPGDDRRDQGAGGRGRHRQPALRRAAHARALRQARAAAAGRGVARAGRALVRAHQQEHLRPLQGPSELGASGLLADWDRVADLRAHRRAGARHRRRRTTRWIRRICGTWPSACRTGATCTPEGSHLAMYDDQETYMRGLIDWLQTLG